MALENETSNMVMPVGPMSNGGGFGFGGDGIWFLILFFLLAGGGWGGMGGFGADGLYPWMNQSNQISGGFQNQMINDNLNGLRDGVYGISNQLCNGFAGVTAAVTNGFSQAEIANNARQIADMNQNFAAQTATLQGFNNVQSQLATCCCDNRLATVQTQNTVATEGAATRLAIQQQTQAILDKMCQQEIDALKSQNLALQNQLNIANLNASQTAQTAALIADNTAQTQYIVNRVAPYPIPAYTVANPVTPAYTA